MSSKHGNLSITSENIFPVIKKWLYPSYGPVFSAIAVRTNTYTESTCKVP